MELEAKEKALGDLRIMIGNNFNAVGKILVFKGEVIKANGDISSVRFTGYELIKAVGRMNATCLISLLIDEAELVEVRDDTEEDGTIIYTFKLECASRMLVVELMIVWKDKR